MTDPYTDPLRDLIAPAAAHVAAQERQRAQADADELAQARDKAHLPPLLARLAELQRTDPFGAALYENHNRAAIQAERASLPPTEPIVGVRPVRAAHTALADQRAAYRR